MLARMRRWIGFIIILLTALPFLTAAGLAVRSVWKLDSLSVKKQSKAVISRCFDDVAWAAISSAGRLIFVRSAIYDVPIPASHPALFSLGWSFDYDNGLSLDPQELSMDADSIRAQAGEYNSGGFQHYIDCFGLQAHAMRSLHTPTDAKATESPFEGFSILVIPVWWSLPLLSLPPLLTLVLYRRAARRRLVREGRCVGCGYDLRGSPGRCPECGLAAEVAVPK